MGLSAALLVVALASRLLPAGCCILCSASVVDTVTSLERDVLPNRLDTATRADLVDKMKKELQSFDNLPLNENTFMGVIDEDTLQQTSNSFLRELKRIVDGNATDGDMVQEILWMLRHQKEAFARSVARFLKEAYCPNKCGMMLQPLIWCARCQKQVHTCRKSYDCGEQTVEVHEMEDLILNCQLNWHHASQGLTDYSFYRVWGNNSETLVKKGKEALLTKHLVGREDEGKYRCELGTVNQGPATIIHFQVKVLPRKSQEEKLPPNVVTQDETSNSQGSDESKVLFTTFHSNTHSLPTSKAEEMLLRGRLIGLLICISVVLVACLAIWLVYRRKPKASLKAEQKSAGTAEETLETMPSGMPSGTPEKQPSETMIDSPAEDQDEQPEESS